MPAKNLENKTRNAVFGTRESGAEKKVGGQKTVIFKQKIGN
jgi:hypothetical protein